MLNRIEIAEDIVRSERQWKRHVRIKFARHLVKSEIGDPIIWNAALRFYGVRDNGSIIPSTTEQLERSIRNDERAASTKIAVAEVRKE